jgi:predicted DNA-binding protein
MAEYTKRVQAVLTDDQYAALADLSARSGKPISLLIREAVEQVYLAKATEERRAAALSRLLSLDAPVADWEQMEDEITQGGSE